MARMLSEDIREQLIREYEASRNAEEVARNYGVHKSTVYRLKQLKEETGSVKARSHHCGRKTVLTPQDMENISAYIEQQPNITIRELNEKLGGRVSDETVRKASIELGWRCKKKSAHTRGRKRVRYGAETEDTDDKTPEGA